MTRGFLVAASLTACLCWPTPLVAAPGNVRGSSVEKRLPREAHNLQIRVRVPAELSGRGAVGSASALGAEGRSFESSRPDLPRFWLREARCIHRYEVGLQAFTDGYAWGRRWHLDTGNGYYGGLQFALATWHRAGGRGNPSRASRDLQLSLAYIVWLNNGRSWGANRQWPTTARLCGLK